METAVFTPGKAGPLPGYLTYLFLRFPGTLGAEESLALECVDTYDRRWTLQGRVWVRQGDSLTLVAPPALFPLETKSLFGLQAPLTIGKVVLRVRPVTWETDSQSPIRGQVIRAGAQQYLALQGPLGEPWETLVGALTQEGLEPVPPGTLGWVKDRGPGFLGPSILPRPRLEDPADAFLLGRLQEAFRLSRQYERGIVDDVDTECLHQYRVHLRRARSLLSLGKMWEVVPEWTRLKNLLRDLLQRTNALRDLDVLLLDLPALVASLPWDQGPKLENWRVILTRRRQGLWKQLKLWLGSPEHRELLDEVDRLFVDLSRYGEPWTVSELAASAFARSAHALKRALKALGPQSPDSTLHEVRIQVKRLRYTLDGLGFAAQAPEVKTLVGLLKESQEGLGVFQDRSILLQHLKEEVETWRPVSHRKDQESLDPLAFGILVGLLVAAHGDQRVRAQEAAQKLRSKPFTRALDRLTKSLRGDPSDGQ